MIYRICIALLLYTTLGVSDSHAQPTFTAAIVNSYTVGTLPTNVAGKLAYVTDGTSNTDCSVGGGSTKVFCIADGTNWATPTSGGSGTNPPPPASSTIGDFWVVRTSPTVLTIGQNCTTTFPCRVAFGTTTFQITAAATATISAGSATAYIYISDAQVLSVGTNGDTVVCSGCTTVGSISAFPPTAIPLWNWTASSGTWSLAGGTDQRTIVQKGADPLATYITQTADTQLKNAQNLAALASGCLSSTTGTGVIASSGAPCGGVGTGNFFGLWSFTPPLSTGYTTDDAGTGALVVTFANGYEYFHAPAQGSNKMFVRYRTAPSTPYTITVAMRHDFTGFNNDSGVNAGYAIGWRDGTGKIIDFRCIVGTSAGLYNCFTTEWTNSATPTAALKTGTANATQAELILQNPILMCISDDGTNIKSFFSIDGNNWTQWDTHTRTTFFGAGGPTQVWYGGNPNGDGVDIALWHWFQGTSTCGHS